jgi:CHASE2 domain-containing sensor protein
VNHNDFLQGALVMASLSIALFFLRYWRATRERLFALFSVAFCLLGANWALASLGGLLAPHAHLFRFLAFVVIALAVIDKNRRRDGAG